MSRGMTVGLNAFLSVGILVMSCGLFSCAHKATYENGLFQNEVTRYEAPMPAGWTKLAAKDADLAFWNARLGGFILVNSTCREYRDATPSVLAKHLLIGIENRTILKESTLPLSGRQAFFQEVRGLLDGASVHLASLTLVKDYCTYDLAYSAPEARFEEGREAFMKLAERFNVQKRGN